MVPDWLFLFVQREVLTCAFYATLLFVSTAFLYHLSIFLKFKIKLHSECWFCMQKTSVCIAKRNSWICGHCSQYNGFTENGSYNKVIEEQHDFNDRTYCKPNPLIKYEQNRLCDSCNRNQEVKVKMLADFVPLDETNFDKEVAEFRKHIESVYKICYSCKLLLEKVLERPTNFSFRRSPSTRPTLNSTADFSMPLISDKQRSTIGGKFLYGIWTIVAYLVIVAILVYLFGLSNYSFIETFTKPTKFSYFKKPLSIEHAKLYEKHYLQGVFSAFSLYLLLAYFRKTAYPTLDSLIVCFFGLLVANSFSYRIFTLTHDALIEFHQMFFAGLAVSMLFNVVHFLFRAFGGKSKQIKDLSKPTAPEATNPSVGSSESKKAFNFAEFEDRTTNIREQIQDLSLTDFNSNLSNGSQIALANSLSSDQTFRRTSVNPFSTYTTALCLSPPNSAPFNDLFKPPANISYFQRKVSQLSLFDPNEMPTESLFGKSTLLNSFSKDQQFIAFTRNAYMCEGKNVCNFSSTVANSSSSQYSPRSPRVLNYYVNYESPFEKRPQRTAASPLYFSNWFNNMLHTFELTLLLLILGLIVVLLSTPIKLNYNSDFNSLGLSIVVQNLSYT